MNCCNNYQNCNCNTGNLSENNDKLKRELGDFVDLLRERVNDIAYDKNYQNIAESVSDVRLELANAIEQAYADIQNTRAGSTEFRPTEPYTGMQYFDTDLGKPIFWNDTVWVDASGETI